MNKTQGVLIYAFNNKEIDYVKLAVEAAKRVKFFLDKPITLVTDSPNWLEETMPESVHLFDNIIDMREKFSAFKIVGNYRNYNDGTLSSKKLEFKNHMRSKTYDITPYDETLVIDCDFLIANDTLKYCWNQPFDFLIWKDAVDLSGYRKDPSFEKLSDYTIDFYWATVFFFRKTKETEIFFNLIEHVKENWNFYKMIYQFSSGLFRNDHTFSVAIHIMNGYTKSRWHSALPGRLLYTTDNDILIDMTDTEFTFLIEKEKYLGEYTLLKTKELNVHVMNKFSISRALHE